MTFNRPSIIPAPARKHARAITLCSAAIAGVAMPTLASAATVGSTHAAPTAAVYSVSKASSASKPVVRDASTTTTSTSASAPAASSSASTSTYTVVAGDTLYGIAQRTLGDGNDYHKLFDLNKDRSEGDGATFTDPNLIDVGWTLLVPTSGGSTASTAPASTTPATTTTTDSSSSSTSQSAPSTSSSDSSSSDSSSTAATTTSSTDSSSSSTGTDSSTGTQQSTSTTSYADNLDGWINQAISVLNANGYSVSYNAIYQTAMNESSGNPDATNGWDSNAASGTPSIGLMQMIQPTFDAYALPGYTDITNPVDNIIAAAIYAQNTYGGLDNVVSARCDGSCWYGY